MERNTIDRGELAVNKIQFYPIGSVVLVKNGIKELMIIARGVGTMIDGKMKFFDYGACLYPEGLTGTNILYFNHEDIEEVKHIGYRNDDDAKIVKNINEIIEKSSWEKGNAYEINLKKMG